MPIFAQSRATQAAVAHFLTWAEQQELMFFGKGELEQMDSRSTKAIKLFYCYAHEDKRLLDELEKHLSQLRRQGVISTWYDQEILPGEEWKQTIDINLRAADIVLLPVSPDFMYSDYCYSIEMQLALERHARGEISIVPIILRPVDWEGAPFSHLQVLPTGGSPVITNSGDSSDKAFADVARGLRKTVEKLRSKNSSLWRFSETKRFATDDVKRNLHRYQRHELLAVDDGVILYPPSSPPSGFQLLNLETVTTVRDLRGVASINDELTNPSKDELLQLHYEGSRKYSKKIDSYLQRKIAEKEKHEDIRPFRTKVGLTQIDYPLSRMREHGYLILHVAPLSYWTVRAFNRQILENPVDSELQVLREESLGDILPAKEQIVFPCPSAFYVELSIVTSDGKLLFCEKDKQSSAVTRSRGRCWSCTIEEGLEWERDIHDGGLDFYEATKQGVYTELAIEPNEIGTISFYGIALEHTHLHSALLGVMTLNIAERDLQPRIDEKIARSQDFVGSRFVKVDSVAQDFDNLIENSAWWHPTGRMRALLALYKLGLCSLKWE